MTKSKFFGTSKSRAPAKTLDPTLFDSPIEEEDAPRRSNPPRSGFGRRALIRDSSSSPSPPQGSPSPPRPKKHKGTIGESSSRASKGKEPMHPSSPPPTADELALALPPIPFPFSEPLQFRSEEHRKRHQRIGRKELIPTSYPDWALLKTLGIDDEVHSKLSKCGLDFLLMNDPGSYRRVVEEFLCTFEAERKGKDKVVDKWKFTLGGTEFEVERAALEEWLHVEPSRRGPRYYHDHHRTKFWKKISSRNEWFYSSYNSTGIKDLIWKVMHHLIAIGINARKELARAVTVPDIDLMMDIDHGDVPDWISILATRFEGYAKEGARTGGIGGGSLITLIAMRCNFSFDFPGCPAPARRTLTLDIMRRSHFLKPGSMSWDHDDQPHIPAVQEKAKKSKDQFKIKNHYYSLTHLTPSPPSSPVRTVPPPAQASAPPTSESIPPSSADWTSQFDRLSADVADLRLGLGRLEEFAHRESEFHHQEAQWVRSSITSIIERLDRPSTRASPAQPWGYPPPFAVPSPSGFGAFSSPAPAFRAPGFAPAPFLAPHPGSSSRPDAARVTSPEDEGDASPFVPF